MYKYHFFGGFIIIIYFIKTLPIIISIQSIFIPFTKPPHKQAEKYYEMPYLEVNV